MSPLSHEPPKSWSICLETGQLHEEAWKILHDMVASGQCETLEDAARILDFQDRELNQDDSFYGF